MFAPPTIPTNPDSLLLAYELLDASNQQLSNLMKFRAEQFERFWYKRKFEPRTPQEINEILAQMDAAQPGQSAQFFAAAKALVDLLEILSPGSLQPEDWYPRYEYTIDLPMYALRVIPPSMEEPEEDGDSSGEGDGI